MIREYRDTDLPAILDFWMASARPAHPNLPEATFLKKETMLTEGILEKVETWVYELDGRVVGFISLTGHEINMLYVDAAAQGKGVGRALIDHVAGLTGGYLYLFVFEQNKTAIAFYEKYGFEIAKTEVVDALGTRGVEMRLALE